jgi:hypothetical protein
MGNRRDFMYRQPVLEDELDAAFAGSEDATQNMSIDADLMARTPPADKSEFGGVMWGFDGTDLGGGTQIRVDQGSAYDEYGRRTATDANYTLTLTKEGNTQTGMGGTPDGAALSITSGFDRWVTVFLVFDRKLDDLRYDGYNNPVYFKRDESFKFYVKAGATEKSHGTLNYTTDKPAREADKVLIHDVIIWNDGGTLKVYEIDTGSNQRTEFYFNVIGTNSPNKEIVKKENIRDALKAMLELYNDHVGAINDRHNSDEIQFSASEIWADGSGGNYGSAVDVKAAIDGIVDDLNGTTVPAGALLVGAKAQTGSWVGNANTLQTAPNLTAGTLEAQLTELLGAVNTRIHRDGDDGIGGNLIPFADGTDLGSAAKSWDVLARDLTVKGNVKSDLIPDVLNTHKLGGLTKAFLEGYVYDLYVTHDLDVTNDLGVLGTALIDSAGDLDCDGPADFAGTVAIQAAGDLDCDGTANFAKATSIEPDSGENGLILNPSASAASGYIAKIISKVGPSVADFVRIGKFGCFSGKSIFWDNFMKHFAASPTATFTNVVGDRSWGDDTSGGAYSSPTWELGGASEHRGLEFNKTAGDAFPKSHGALAAPLWAIGAVNGLVCQFTVSLKTALPGTGEHILIGFTNSALGTVAAIRIKPSGAYGYFDPDGVTPSEGANLVTGAMVVDTLYTFRVAINADNEAQFWGPNGNYTRNTGGITIPSASEAQFGVYYNLTSGTSNANGYRLHEVVASEQKLLDIG